MVSNANEDFPLPLNPVITVRLLRGMLTSIFFRLWTFAPIISILSLSFINNKSSILMHNTFSKCIKNCCYVASQAPPVSSVSLNPFSTLMAFFILYLIPSEPTALMFRKYTPSFTYFPPCLPSHPLSMSSNFIA